MSASLYRRPIHSCGAAGGKEAFSGEKASGDEVMLLDPLRLGPQQTTLLLYS